MTELAALIGDLQELSRPDTGQHEGRTRILAWHDVVESALRRARLRGPELAIDADVRPWYVRAEPAALERAVVNILDNAVKFSPDGGTIGVRLADGVLTVRDHGPGIPADELPTSSTASGAPQRPRAARLGPGPVHRGADGAAGGRHGGPDPGRRRRHHRHDPAAGGAGAAAGGDVRQAAEDR